MELKAFFAPVLAHFRTLREGVHAASVKVDPGGGPLVTLDVVGPAGDDSPPLVLDYALGVPARGEGRAVAVGFADPTHVGLAGKGERRLFARDLLGNPVCTVWLRDDGTIELFNNVANVKISSVGTIEAKNANGSLVLSSAGALSAAVKTADIANGAGSLALDASGVWTINGATITADGDFITADGKSLRLHTHPQANDSGGNVEQPTGPPV